MEGSEKMYLLRKYLVLSLFGFAIILLQFCSEDDYSTNTGDGNPGANEVFLQNTSFSPSTKTVSAGTTVKWTNKDNTTHTVTSGTPGNPDGMFDSGNMGMGATFSFTFQNKGTFNYYCRPHSGSMQGTITVE